MLRRRRAPPLQQEDQMSGSAQDVVAVLTWLALQIPFPLRLLTVSVFKCLLLVEDPPKQIIESSGRMGS